ncbi:MAG TPA: toll/interleukin-1 receptor domain-containing protein [Thermoanaerobaculia bacterium]
MPGIFISYRRIDTLAWAGRLFADLRKSFGASQVFMDINGGIPRGADFEQALTAALAGCEALLALIGSQWIGCTSADGTRRLDVPADWVRNEISTALRRDILVMPVLFGGAPLPGEAELPEDLRALLKRQRAKVDDEDWDYHIGELIKDLIKQTSLRPLDDVVSASTVIRLLKDLMTERPAVADAVSRSKEVIENTYSQLGRLVLFKRIHDSLHDIEVDCLRPIQAGGPTGRLRPFKIRFAGEARRIQEAIQEKEFNAVLRDDLVERLDSTTAALETAVQAPSEAAYGRVLGELNGLLSGVSPPMDMRIAEAAAGLNLDRLLELMGRVRDTLPPPAAGKAPELEPFVQGIDALSRLRDELNKRVSEHGLFQRLDSKLRTVCVGGILPGMLAGEWVRIRLVRSRLAPPFSPELGAVNDDLVAIEGEIEASLGQGNEAAAQDLVSEYFRAVSSVFRDIDGCLKEFCLRLSAVAQPLKTVLSMV